MFWVISLFIEFPECYSDKNISQEKLSKPPPFYFSENPATVTICLSIFMILETRLKNLCQYCHTKNMHLPLDCKKNLFLLVGQLSWCCFPPSFTAMHLFGKAWTTFPAAREPGKCNFYFFQPLQHLKAH